jgi:type II secretory pathway pseudopilin PulG
MVSRSAGFTLVEVVVASFGVAFGLAGVLMSFSALMRTARMVDAESRAMHQARQHMEQLRTASFSAPPLAIGTHTISNGFYVVSASSPTSTLRQITVTLNAITPNHATARVDLATVLSSELHK